MAAWRNEIYLRVLRGHVISSISLSMRADFVVCPRVRPHSVLLFLVSFSFIFRPKSLWKGFQTNTEKQGECPFSSHCDSWLFLIENHFTLDNFHLFH